MKILHYIKWLFVLPLFATLSWIAVHFFAATGFFILIGLFFVWIISPRKISCVFCHLNSENTICPVCRELIKKNNRYPKNLTSAFSNFALFLLGTLMCLFVVFLEKSFLTKLNFITHQTVTLVAPDTHAFYLNKVFNFDIKVDNITQAINAAQFELNYNPKLLEALDVDFSQSFANIFLEKEVDNNSGYIRVSGGLPNPGITDKQAIFATIYFKAISPGTSPIKILPRSQVLANDGHGTNILKSTDEYQILILPEIASNQEPTTIEALKQSKPVLGITTNHQDIQDYTKATMDIFRNLPHPDTEKINQTLNQDTFIQRLFRKIITLDDFILNIFRIKH